jgi:hypothetical protein
MKVEGIAMPKHFKKERRRRIVAALMLGALYRRTKVTKRIKTARP